MEVALVRRESWASVPGSPARSLLLLRSQHTLWPRLDSSTCEKKKSNKLWVFTEEEAWERKTDGTRQSVI